MSLKSKVSPNKIACQKQQGSQSDSDLQHSADFRLEFVVLQILLGQSAKMAGWPIYLWLALPLSSLIYGLYFLPRAPTRFQHMWRLTWLSWILVVWYSQFVSWITKCNPLIIPAGYVGALLVFYGWHILAHQRWTGMLYKVHMEHHIDIYPASNYLSDKHHPTHSFFSYKGFCHEGPLYFAVLVQLGLLNYFFHPHWDVGALVLLGLLFFAWAGTNLHYAMHIRGHYLERFHWFLMVRELHWIHHKGDMKKNYMLINFSLDQLFHSKNFVMHIDPSKAGTAGKSN